MSHMLFKNTATKVTTALLLFTLGALSCYFLYARPQIASVKETAIKTLTVAGLRAAESQKMSGICSNVVQAMNTCVTAGQNCDVNAYRSWIDRYNLESEQTSREIDATNEEMIKVIKETSSWKGCHTTVQDGRLTNVVCYD